MATKISTSSGLIANSAGRSCTLDSVRLRHLSLDDSPLEALTLSRACLEVLEQGDSLAWYLGAPFRVDTVRKAVSALFDNPHPHLCGTETAGTGHAQEWDDIVREFDPQRFEYHGGAVYQGHFRGQLVQLSEKDWNMIQSGIPRMLVSPWPPMRHIHAELETVAYAITELTKWNRQALEAIEQNKSLLHTLTRRIGWLHSYSRQSSSTTQVQSDLPVAGSHISPIVTNKSATVSANMDVTEHAGEVSVEASGRYVRQSDPTQHLVHKEDESSLIRHDLLKEIFELKRPDDLNQGEKSSQLAWFSAHKNLRCGEIKKKVLDDGQTPCQESAQAPARRRNRRARSRKAARLRRDASSAAHLGLDSCIN